MKTEQNQQKSAQSAISAFYSTLPYTFLILAVLGYALYFSSYTLTRYAAFESRALDMGNLNQAVWNTAFGDLLRQTNQPGVMNRLSLHVEPILLPIAAIYRVFPGPQTLLVLQAIIVALGALPTFGLAKLKLGSRWLALLFALTFLLNPSIQAANFLEFHPVTLAPTFLLAALFFLFQYDAALEQKIRVNPRKSAAKFLLFILLAAACKEEIGLLTFMLGLYAFIFLRRRRLGATTAALSLAWALTAVLVIQPLFATDNIHWSRYGWLGDGPAEMVIGLVTQPRAVLAQLGGAQALRYVALMVLPVGGLALLAPEVLLLALPSLGINLLADAPFMHETSRLIYAAPIVPFATAAGIVGAQRLLFWTQKYAELREFSFAPLRLCVGLFILATALVNQLLFGYLPFSRNHVPYAVTAHDRRAAAVLDQIPPDARVSAQDRLDPHVSGRETVYIFPRLNLENDPAAPPDADAILLDTTGPAWPLHPSDVRATVDGLLVGEYGIAAADHGYLLLTRDAAGTALPNSFYDAWLTPPSVADSVLAEFGDVLRLHQWRVTTQPHTEPGEPAEVVVEFLWSAQQALERDYKFYVALADADLNVLSSTEFLPPTAQLWFPTSRWPAGRTVQVETLPWNAADAGVDELVLLLGVHAGDSWNSGERLPVALQNPTALPRLDGHTLLRLGGYQQARDGLWHTQWQPIPLVDQPPATPLDARFGEHITLDGVTLPDEPLAPGDTLPFTLHWQTDQPLNVDYTAFVHLLDASGERVAQLDWTPHDAISQLPTSAWLPEQSVVDRQTLSLPEDLAVGEYGLIVGWYDGRDGVRLPVGEGDVLEVGKVQIN